MSSRFGFSPTPSLADAAAHSHESPLRWFVALTHFPL
jgi:hypothetical protein